MHRIITLTWSPALDKSTSVPSMQPDKKLMCSIPRFDPGGGGVNVSRALARLGTSSLAVFPSGGHSGHFFCDLLQMENLNFHAVPCSNPTREHFMVLDESTQQQYRFGMPSAVLSEQEWRTCLDAIQTQPFPDFLVISGSWPASVPLSCLDEISIWAKEHTVKLVIDTAGEALKKAIQIETYMMKPNLGELALLLGKNWLDTQDVVADCQELLKNNNTEIMVVSMGVEGALLITKNESFQVKPPAVERKSTVGAGDSMVAGLLHALSQSLTYREVLKYGVACGTAATMHPGTELCQPEDVRMILERLQ